jgi:replicative DNA helicase
LYYLGLLETAHIQKTLSTAASVAQGHMKADPKQSLAIMEDAVHALRANQQTASVMDFRKAGPRVMKHLTSKWSGKNYISLGWPSFDDNSGGLMAGDFFSIAGFTGAGKTWILLSRAFHIWQNHKLPVVFISAGMGLDALKVPLIF